MSRATVTNRTVETEHDKTMALRLIEGRELPFTLSLTSGKHRSTAQNRLQFLWANEIAHQKGDMTVAEVRAYCKLTIGVPILRSQNEAFRVRYDEVVRPLPYEQKLALMSEPLDMPVTRLMTTKQKAEYLDGIQRHFGEQGIVLTIPEDLRNELYQPSAADPTADAGGSRLTPSSPGPARPDPAAAGLPAERASSGASALSNGYAKAKGR